MSEEINYQSDESYISVLKHHYVAMIILPICFIFAAKLTIGLQINSNHLLLKSITNFMGGIGIIASALWVTLLLIIYLFKGMFKTSLYIFLTSIMTMILSITPVLKYGIDADWINIFLYKNEYLHIIEKQPSMATDGDARLVKIEMKSNWSGCHSYIVYDESDEMSNPHGNFRGLNYMYFTDLQGNKHKEKAYDVTVKNYGDHLYIVHLCANTGV